LVSEILKTQAKSIHHAGEPREYQDLLRGRFNIDITRIERTDNVNDISNKLFDYSADTITQLRQDGYNDALMKIQK
jgi:hypothetical protein